MKGEGEEGLATAANRCVRKERGREGSSKRGRPEDDDDGAEGNKGRSSRSDA